MASNLTSVTGIIQNVFSYNGNALLAAIVALLLVILFVLLLHLSAKWWFLSHSRRRRDSASITIPSVASPPAPFHHFPTFNFEDSPHKGLDSSAVASIPVFVYGSKEHGFIGSALQCVICLSAFQINEIGRNLPNCGHAFHLECIDMWLRSHSNCPVCRAPAVDLPSVPESVTSGEAESVDNVEESASGTVVDITSSDESENADEDFLLATSSSSFSSSSPLPISGCSLKRMRSMSKLEVRPYGSFFN